jgi:transcriptional regulator with PAS, ATPase and Fis domain
MSEPRDRFLGSSLAARRVRSWIDHAARVDATVLILGESGVGKEIVAREIHDRSQRASQPFVPVNCAAIPETLIESELFGHAAGAFTDARGARRGAFELADRGTLFLDEVGDLSSQAQPKLLRSLEAREIVPVGSESARPVDLRVIAATNHDLMAMTLAGAFRSDLYFRVRVLEIRVPPLRERPEDIPELAAHVLRLLDAGDPRGPLTIVPQAVRALQAYSWPGNVRELRAVLERAAALAGEARELDATHFGFESLPTSGASRGELRLRAWRWARATFESAYARHLVRKTGGDVRQASKVSGLALRSIYKMLHRQGLMPRADH